MVVVGEFVYEGYVEWIWMYVLDEFEQLVVWVCELVDVVVEGIGDVGW